MTFLLVPLYTSVLSTSDYSMVDIMTTTTTLCIYIFTLGMSNSVMRFTLSKVRCSDLVLIYGLHILFKGTIIITIGAILSWYLNLLKWNGYYYIFFIGIFISQGLEQILSSYLRAIDKVQIMVVASLISTGARFILSVATLIFFKWGVVGYLMSMIIGAAASSIFSCFYIFPLKRTVIDAMDKVKLHREMRNYGIFATVNSIGWWAANGIDKYFLIWLQGSAINGIYAVSYKIPVIVSTLCSIFSQAWGLSAIKEYDPNDKSDKEGFFTNVYALYKAGLIFSSTILIFLNVGLAKLIFANDFFEAWKYSSILIIAAVFCGLASFLGGIFSAAFHNRELATTMIISTGINIVLNAILIPLYSALGAAIATLIAYYTIWVMRYSISRKYLDFKTRFLRDHLAFGLLIVQIIMENQDGHLYIGQIIIMASITLLYRKELNLGFAKSLGDIKNRLKDERNVLEKK